MKSNPALWGIVLLCLSLSTTLAASLDSLSLEEALNRSGSDPGIQAAESEVKALKAVASQASALANPRLSFEAENFAGTGPLSGADALETTVRLEQSVELGNKRGLRRQQAEAERSLAELERDSRRAQVALEVRQSFFEVLWRQERTRLAEHKAFLLEEALKAASRLGAAGGGSVGAEGKIRLELSVARLEAVRERAAGESARRSLAVHLGDSAGFAGVRGDLRQLDSLPEWESLRRSLDQHPDLVRWRSEQSLRLAMQRAGSAENIPTLDVSAGMRQQRDPSGNHYAWVGGVSLPLPLWNRNQGTIRGGALRVSAAQAEGEAARRTLLSRTRTLWDGLQIRADEIREMQDHILPEAEASAQFIRSAHASGRLGALDLLDAERTLFEVQERYLDALAAYQQDRAELQSISSAAQMAAGREKQ